MKSLKCVCTSCDIEKTGHMESCPAYSVKNNTTMVRKATAQTNLKTILAQLIQTVKNQQKRIDELEKLVNSTLNTKPPTPQS